MANPHETRHTRRRAVDRAHDRERRAELNLVLAAAELGYSYAECGRSLVALRAYLRSTYERKGGR